MDDTRYIYDSLFSIFQLQSAVDGYKQ